MSNIINLTIKYDDIGVFEHRLSIDEPIITINDDFVLNILGNNSISKDSIRECSFSFGLANAYVKIVDYTLTDEVSINGFFNQSSYIAYLICINTRLHIIDQHIKEMQIDGDSVLIGRCNIDKISFGLNKQGEALKNNNIENAEIHINKIDIRGSVIHEMNLLASCDDINIQESEIKILRFDHRFGITKDKPIDNVRIWRNCTINTVEISCPINVLKISESAIYTLMSKTKCKIDTLEIDQSVITNAYNFDLNNFGNLDRHSWQIISKSASSSKNFELRAKANYNIANIYTQEKKSIEKFSLMFFKITTGYGYKPFRIVTFSLITIIIFSLIFLITDNLKHILNISIIIFNSFIEKIFFSLCNFIGFSSNSSSNTEYVLVFAMLENIIGIIAFAMFVNALYVKYKD